MKYLLACLIIPVVPVLLVAVFGIGALYFGVTNLLEHRLQQKISAEPRISPGGSIVERTWR